MCTFASLKPFTMKTINNVLATALCLMGLLFTVQSQAQTVNAGAWMVGGLAGFESSKADGDDDATNTILINPNIGYFVIDNLGIGLNLGFANVSHGDFSSTGLGVGPYARYYVFQGLFPQVGIMYNSTKFEDEDAVTSTDINLGVGYSFFLNNSVAVEPMLGYTIGGGDDKTNTFGLMIGVQAFLGRN